MDTEKQRQRRHNDSRLTESGDARSEQLLVMPTESLLSNGEWLPGELLSGLERRTRWFLHVDKNIGLVLAESNCNWLIVQIGICRRSSLVIGIILLLLFLSSNSLSTRGCGVWLLGYPAK